jgi:hypothetical protein
MRMKEITKMGWLGLLLLLPACEKDVLGPDTGGGVPIEFSMSNAGFDEGEEVRSSGSVKPETVVVPLGEGNLYLYATLREEPAEALRAQEVGLQPNQKVRLAAYKGTDQQGSTLTYTYSGGQLTPDGGTPLKVEPDNSNYTFVAYSSYSAPTTAVTNITSMNPSIDLVWGSKAQPVTTTESTQKVSIKMTHKFARVRVKIDASTIASAITAIGTTYVKSDNLTLTEYDGSVVKMGSIASSQVVNFPVATSNIRTSNYNTSWQTVNEVTISSITLTIAAVDKTFANLRIAFSKTLESGKSYTLEVDIMKRLIFAGSNIYWDESNSRLTFDESTNSTYQGVYFKWGSLVGLSAVGAFDNTLRLYIPNVSMGTWDGTKTLGSSSWSSHMNLPHITGVYGTGAADNYLYDHPDWSNYKGDICAYLTGKPGIPAGNWRMPNAEELGLLTYGTWISSGTTSNLNDAGTGTITIGWDFGNGGFFPASGWRNVSNSPLVVGTTGYYDTGTPAGTDASNKANRSYLRMSTGLLMAALDYDIDFSVRCLKI